jgi:lysophospholipase L1-like esterase
MNKRECYAMVFAAASLGLLWLYFVLVMFLGRSIGGRDIGLGLIALSLPFALGVFFIVIRTIMVRGIVSSKQLVNFSLVVCVSLGSLFILDIIYAIHLKSQAFEKPRLEDSRLFDSGVTWRELYPRLYYPTDRNFRLHKANFSVSGAHYGLMYSPELMESPTLAKSVLELQQFSCIIDQHGFRNTIALDQADIFTLGDSFTFGWAVDSTRSWVGILEHAIHRPIYNLGILDSSPKQELELLKYMIRTSGKSMQIRTLVWMIYEGNDLEDTYRDKRLAKPNSSSHIEQLTEGTILQSLHEIPYLIQKQAMITKIRNKDIVFRIPRLQENGYNPYVIDGIRSWFPFYQSAVLGPRLFIPQYIERAGKPFSYVLNHPNRPRLDQVFEEMAQLGNEFSFNVIVVIAPTAERLHGPFFENFPSISDKPHFIDYVATLSEQMGFRTLNLLPFLSTYGDKELLYLRDDDHWNKKGHAIAAEIIFREIFQQGTEK